MMNKKICLIPLIICISLVACSKKKPVLPPHHVDVLKVKAYDVPYEFDYPGMVTGVADFPVQPRVSGVIFKQLYTEGTFIKKGQPLYEIDRRPYEAQLASDEGQLVKDSSAMKENKIILDRYKKLLPLGAVSQQDVDSATINYKSSLGQTLTDQAAIKNDKLNLEYCMVTAPVSGLISERQVTVGTMVQAYQTTLNNINSKDNLYINFSLPENDRLYLTEGVASGSISVPNNYKFEMNLELADGTMLNNVGTVNFYDTRISQQNGTWNMRGDVDNQKLKQQLLSGQFVHVYLTGTKFKNAFSIPQSAIYHDNDGAFVYTLDSKSEVVKTPITTGFMVGENWIVISGLKNGMGIITDGGMKVIKGDKVVVDVSKEQTS